MKKLTILSILFISLAFVAPIQVSAATNAGVKPGSFFYFFDTAFENVSLFFTFNSESKAKKALEYADERLAEIEAVAEGKNPDAVKAAITNYKSNVALATEKSKEVKDKGQAENLLTLIEDSTSRNQEILSAVLIKVPEEAKEAIMQAIEASRKGQEEATKQISELKGEVEKLKKEVAELKSKEEGNTKTSEELNNQKSKNISTTTKSQTSPVFESTQTPKLEIPAPFQTPTKVSEPQITPPTNQSTNNTTPPQTPQPTPAEILKISSVNVVPDMTSAKIEWETNQPTESKLYLSGGGLNSKLFASEAGYATKHFASIIQLTPITDYSFQITAIGGNGFADISGSFKTKIPAPTLQMTGEGSKVSLGSIGRKISWKTTYVSSCAASGNWSGEKDTIGEYILSFTETGNYTYGLTCVGNNGENISKSVSVNVIDTKPKITFYFNGNATNTYTANIGSSVRMSWEFSYATTCTASGDWDGDKHTNNHWDTNFNSQGVFYYIITCTNTNGEKGSNTATITVVQ